MKKIVIIEDERLAGERLVRLINDYDDTITIDGPLKSVDAVCDYLSKNEDYDLIISDIRLFDQTIFEAFEQYPPKSFVIFTTAYDEYALQAIQSGGIDYLMKPINALDLSTAFDKISRLANQGEIQQSISEVARHLHAWRCRFLVSKQDQLISLKVEDISCINNEGRHVTFYTPTGEKYTTQEKLADFESMLDPDMFFRINRQYIANINYLKTISTYFSSKLIVRIQGCDDEQIIISKDRASKFKEWLTR